MNFAEIKRLKELLKTLQESGEMSTRTRMEVGKAIEAIRKERATARTAADVNIEQPLNLIESSYEKSAALGEKWKPPWDPTWSPLSKEEFLKRPGVAGSREDILGLVEKGIVKEQHVTLLGDLPDKDIPELY